MDSSWLSWEYMFGVLEGAYMNQCSDGEITEEEYERLSDHAQSLDVHQLRQLYDEFKATGHSGGEESCEA